MAKPSFHTHLRRRRFSSSPPPPHPLSGDSNCHRPIYSRLRVSFHVVYLPILSLEPIERQAFPENLPKVVSEREYPSLDVLICTADPTKEPPIGVVNTVLSVLAYDYPTDKLSLYVSDDGGSKATLYALMEGAKFGKKWIPYCKKHNIVDRSPEVYFRSHHALISETDEIKVLID